MKIFMFATIMLCCFLFILWIYHKWQRKKEFQRRKEALINRLNKVMEVEKRQKKIQR